MATLVGAVLIGLFTPAVAQAEPSVVLEPNCYYPNFSVGRPDVDYHLVYGVRFGATGIAPGDTFTGDLREFELQPDGSYTEGYTFGGSVTADENGEFTYWVGLTQPSKYQLTINYKGQTYSKTLPVLCAGFAERDLDFGSSTGAQPVSLTNEGAADIKVSDLAVDGANPDDFDVSPGDCSGSLAPGEGCTASVSFTPGGAGERSATLSAVTDASNTPTVALTGTGESLELKTSSVERRISARRLGRGLEVAGSCAPACQVHGELRMGERATRRLGLPSTLLVSGEAIWDQGGTLKLRTGGAGRAALRAYRGPTFKLHLQVSGEFAGRNGEPVSSALKRKTILVTGAG